MSEKKRIVTNSDNEYLMPWGNEQMAIGYVDEVNGNTAVEVPEFHPTHHELLQLVKYWKTVALDIEYFWFLFEQVGSSDTRQQSFAYRRINRIAVILGDEAVKRTIDEVYEEFGKKQNPKTWDIFLNGTKEQWEEVRNEIHRQEKEAYVESGD
jgi:hypothetical protein